MAVFNPIPTFPISGEGADALNIIRVTWDFVSTNNETQDSYRVQMYNINDTGTIVHDSGVVTSSDEFYDVPATSLTNGNNYVFRVTVVSGAVSRSNSQFAHFKTLQTPTIVIDTIGSVGQFQTFTAQYSQTQGVALRSYQWVLYDNSDVILETGTLTLGEPIQQTFTGFENNTTYRIDVTVVNQNNVTVTSTRESFTTSYTIPDDSPTVQAIARPEYVSNEVDWTDIVVLTATISGNSQYVDGKFNRALELQNRACLQLDLTNFNIPETFTQSFWVKHSSTDTWSWEVQNNNQTLYEVGWNVDKQKFYYERGDRFCLSLPVTLTSEYYLVVIRPDRVDFMFFDNLGNETRRFEFR